MLKNLKTARHDGVVKALYQLLFQIGLRQGILREAPLTYGDIHRRADIKFIRKQIDGYVDVAVVNPACTKYLSRWSGNIGGQAGVHKEALKTAKYQVLGEAISSKFIPFIVDATGRLAPKAVAFINNLTGFQTPGMPGDDRLAGVRRFFYLRVMASVVKGNAAMVQACLDHSTVVQNH